MPYSVAAYLPDDAARARLLDALARLGSTEPAAHLRFVDRPVDLVAALRAGAAPLAVLDVSPAQGCSAVFVRGVAQTFPHTSILAWSDFQDLGAREIFELALAGIVEVVIAGVEDTPKQIALLLENALSRTLARRVQGVLADVLPATAEAPFYALLAAARRPLTPEDAARLALCHPSTLRVRLLRAGLPSAGKLIVWMRLLHAAARLELARGGAARVAASLEFPSETALRNQLRRYAGMKPAELTAPGGPERLCAEFRRRYEARDWSLHASPRRPRTGRSAGA